MKKLLCTWVGLAVVLAIAGSGCGGSDDSSDGAANPLVGRWTGTMGADDPADPDITVVLTANANGTYTAAEDGVVTETGTWSVNGNVLVLSGSDPEQTITYSIDGNILALTVTSAEGGGTLFFTRI